MSDLKITAAASKVPFGILPKRVFSGVARVMARGAKTYAIGNWYEASLEDDAGMRYASSLERHYCDIQAPNGTFTRESLATLDHDSGLPAIDHMIACLMILRGILTKEGVLPADPGEGKPVVRKDGWANVVPPAVPICTERPIPTPVCGGCGAPYPAPCHTVCPTAGQRQPVYPGPPCPFGCGGCSRCS